MNGEVFFKDPKEEVTRMTGVERVNYGVMKALKRNFSVTSVRLVDCSEPMAFLKRINQDRDKAERITYVAMVIRAVGLALTKYPRLGWMKKGWRFVKPSTADVGCSVATEQPVSPVIVIRDAGNKGLEEINQELRNLAVKARKEEKQNLEKIERLSKIVPIKWFLHLLLRILMTRQRFIRHTIGNFQVSVLNQTELEMAVTSHLATNLLMIGRIRDRALVEDGQVAIRPAAYFSFNVDHTLHGASHGLQFITEVCRLLNNPEELL